MNKRYRVVGLSILTAVLLSGCTNKRTQFKSYNEVQDNHIERVESNDKIDNSDIACVGDHCIAKITKTSKCTNPIKAFSILKSPKTETRAVFNLSTIDRFPQIESYSQTVSIQVGAFRNYSGAEIYKRRYSMLSSQYKAVIKNGQKDAEPIFRVQIEGFKSELEAKRFISKHIHSLSRAFLVRR
jgi:hypothetical protein